MKSTPDETTTNPSHRWRPGKRVIWSLLISAIILVPLVFLTINAMAQGEKERRPVNRASSASLEWYDVNRQNFDLTITASGNLEASNQVEIRCQVEGRPTIIDIVPEGAAVKKGEILVKLADDQIRKDIEEESLNVESARSDKVAAEKNLAIELTKAESEERAARVKLELARLQLEKWEMGDLVQRRKELQLALETAERNLERAKRDLELSKQLYADKFISFNELDEDELSKIEAEAALETAMLAIEVYDKYTYTKELKQNTSDVEQAEAELKRIIAENERLIERARIQLESETRRLKIREDRLAEQKTQLEATTIRAPQDGLVVYASTVDGGRRRDDNPIGEGKELHYNEKILVLPNTDQMVASVQVHESMIPFVQVGQNVSIQIDAMPGQPVKGAVSNVAVMAEDGGWWNRDLRQYRVRVEIDSHDDETASSLKPAMRCTAQIYIGHVEDSLAVPIQSVHVDRRQRFCYVAAGRNRVKKMPVTTGRASDTLVEITEGLKEGDRVLLRAPLPGEIVDES